MDAAAENTVTNPVEEGRRAWVPPLLRTFTPEELLAEMGPAQGCSPYSPPGGKPGEMPSR